MVANSNRAKRNSRWGSAEEARPDDPTIMAHVTAPHERLNLAAGDGRASFGVAFLPWPPRPMHVSVKFKLESALNADPPIASSPGTGPRAIRLVSRYTDAKTGKSHAE